MSQFSLDKDNRFTIDDYQNQRPFSNILPGIAGHMGIPMWVFYVNRGQAITSFGVENKDHPIMEFQPANKAYQVTPFRGFRTFIKIMRADEQILYEPFAAGSLSSDQRMIISLNELELQEQNLTHGLRIEILYHVLPEEQIAGLIRQVKITNLAMQSVQFEVLDGLPGIMPYGVSNSDLKEVNRTVEAWMDVYNLEHKLPFFHLSSTLGDTAEIKVVQAGNFAICFASQQDFWHQLAPIVTPEAVFGQNTALSFPSNFQNHTLNELLEKPQLTRGKTPCAFFGFPARLPSNDSITLFSIYGYAPKLKVLNGVTPRLSNAKFFHDKHRTANEITDELTRPITTKTSAPIFDAYCKQTFLDNILRGGWPVHLGRSEKPITYHIYSRKHGDPERDYNAFFLAAEFFSQGNGNYRDVNQNRRSEIWFEPRVADSNIFSFMSLIQADGYNPLVVKGSWFWIPPEKRAVLTNFVLQPERLAPLLNKKFTPGGLIKEINDLEIELSLSTVDFTYLALDIAEQHFEAEFSEGYWIDHWIYNLDLIDSYLSIYPDRCEELLFSRQDLTFFDSPFFVQPRNKKYILAANQPRQYDAVVRDKEKAALLVIRDENPNMMRVQNGRGDIYRTNLYAKLLVLALVKFATLDPMGMGIEMEANKPGWCDALNGLPGLFGSSMSETFELARLLSILYAHIPEEKSRSIRLPNEVVKLLRTVVDCLQIYHNSTDAERDFQYWNAVSTARETYRGEILLGIDGEEISVPFQTLAEYLSSFQNKVQAGIAKALQMNGSIPPTYLTYEIEEYEILSGPDRKPLTDEKQRPRIRALRFRQKVLPLFLEGPVHMLKTLTDSRAARRLHQAVKKSELYDGKLNMYKTNVSLESETMEIGRLRAFTPGWLENESIFLHMEYKYLLELLKAGLYKEFFEDFRSILIAFQDPARYRRSPLENSSFLVSSAHPDESLHGAGFVARLTGATAEFVNMWTIMMVGQNPFYIDEGALHLRLKPALPDWLFDEDDRVRFTFLGSCLVTYFNPQRQNTYNGDLKIQSMRLFTENDQSEVRGGVIKPPHAAMVREGNIKRIEVDFASPEINI